MAIVWWWLMPSYDSRCNDCGRADLYVSTLDNRHIVPNCTHCGGKAHKVILTAPKGYVKGNFDAFRSPVDGSVISTSRALSEHNTRNQVVNLHEGYDDAKIVAGDFSREASGPDKKDIAVDVAKSIQKINDGYKPVIGVTDATDSWN